MLKVIIISSFLFLTFISCQKDNVTAPFNYESDTPVWLKANIDRISTNQEYYGTKIYRYEWQNKFVYHIMIPISSCAYCEMYYQSGNKIQIASDEMFTEFIENRKNGILVWEWEN